MRFFQPRVVKMLADLDVFARVTVLWSDHSWSWEKT